MVADRKCTELPAEGPDATLRRRRRTAVLADRRGSGATLSRISIEEYRHAARLVESAGAAGQGSALLPNRTLAIDRQAPPLIPELEALVHRHEARPPLRT